MLSSAYSLIIVLMIDQILKTRHGHINNSEMELNLSWTGSQNDLGSVDDVGWILSVNDQLVTLTLTGSNSNQLRTSFILGENSLYLTEHFAILIDRCHL